MDSVLQKFRSIRWAFPDSDREAFDALRQRIAATGRSQNLITYSELVAGVTFRLPTVNRGEPFQIGAGEWTELHRMLVGDFLGRLAWDNYERAGFLASALVVSKLTGASSDGFRTLVREIGLLGSSNPDDLVILWSLEVKKAYDWSSTQDR
jgi:hypothetical protein